MMTSSQEALARLADDAGAVRFGATGVGIVLAALWEHAISLAVGIFVFAVLFDLISGVARAIDRDGLSSLSRDKFMSGARVVGVAVVGMGLGVLVDLLLREAGATWQPCGTAAAIYFGGFYCWSAAQNVAYFFSGFEDVIGAGLKRVQRHDAERRNRRHGDEGSGDA